MRDSFVFYKSFREAIKHLPPDEQLAVYNAIADYSLDGIHPELNGVAAAVFVLVKPQIDANQKRYENGKKGGKPPQSETKTEPNTNQDITKTEPNVNDNVNANENENIISISRKRERERIDKIFSEFWKVYPRKVGKADAKKVFDKIKPTDELFAAMLKAIGKFKSSEGWSDERFIQYPATWLNKRMWEDFDELAGLSTEEIKAKTEEDSKKAEHAKLCKL